eukprot:Pgem_evm1s19209
MTGPISPQPKSPQSQKTTSSAPLPSPGPLPSPTSHALKSPSQPISQAPTQPLPTPSAGRKKPPERTAHAVVQRRGDMKELSPDISTRNKSQQNLQQQQQSTFSENNELITIVKTQLEQQQIQLENEQRELQTQLNVQREALQSHNNVSDFILRDSQFEFHIHDLEKQV